MTALPSPVYVSCMIVGVPAADGTVRFEPLFKICSSPLTVA